MKRAMESRGLGKLVGKHEHYSATKNTQVDRSQGYKKEFKTEKCDPEVKSQKEDPGPRVHSDQYLPCPSDHSLGEEKHGHDEQPSHNATSSCLPSPRCPKHESISEPAANSHGDKCIREASHPPYTSPNSSQIDLSMQSAPKDSSKPKTSLTTHPKSLRPTASIRPLRTPRLHGRYTGRSRRSHTARPSNILQVRTSSSRATITTVTTIINHKNQQKLRKINPRMRSSSSTQITSETLNMTIKGLAQCLTILRISRPSDSQIAIHPNLQNWHASQRTESIMTIHFPPIMVLQVRSLLSPKQQSIAQVTMDTDIKEADAAWSEHLADLRLPNSKITELNNIPSEVSAEEQGTCTRSNLGPRLWTDNSNNARNSEHGVIAPKTGFRIENTQKMRVWAFDNNPAPGFQAMIITDQIPPFSSALFTTYQMDPVTFALSSTVLGHRASDRLIKANTANVASQPLLQYHIILELPQEHKSDYQIHRITNSVYLMLLMRPIELTLSSRSAAENATDAHRSVVFSHEVLTVIKNIRVAWMEVLDILSLVRRWIGHSKACLFLILSVTCGTDFKVQGWVYLPLRCLQSLSRQPKMPPHRYFQRSVPF